MANELIPYIRRVRIDGYDGQLMHFRVRSYSRPNLLHEITLDRLAEKAKCTCEDATYRKTKRYWYLLVPEGTMCKHLATLRDVILPDLQRQGYK